MQFISETMQSNEPQHTKLEVAHKLQARTVGHEAAQKIDFDLFASIFQNPPSFVGTQNLDIRID